MNTKKNMLLISAFILLLVGVITVSAAAAPTISSISPKYGPASENVKVIILGTGFTNNSHVWFDGQDITAEGSTTFVNSGKITVTKYKAPQTPRTVHVSIKDSSVTSNIDQTFTFVGQPVISNVNPNNGPISGGNTVKITGVSFLGTTSVKFGTEAATSFAIDSDNQITAVVPHGVNLVFVDVTVTNSVKKNNGNMINLTSIPGPGATYEYYQGPVIYSVVPNQGSVVGGNEVIINGAGFTPGYLEADGVIFGDVNADILSYDDHSIKVSAPAITSKQSDKPKAVNIKVTINGVTVEKSAAYNYIVNPYITGISPDTGKLDGGNKVTLTGYGFTGVSEVRFTNKDGTIVYETYKDDTLDANVKFVDDRKLTVIVPPGYNAPDFVKYVQVVSDGSINPSPVSTAYYQYQQLPTISSMVPSQGPAGTTVTLTLKDIEANAPLLPVKKVLFGSVEATDVTINTQKITAVAPPQVAGTTKVAVKLVTAGGTSVNNPKFTYVLPPVFPVANFTSNVTSGNAPLSVKFTDLSENADEVSWDFENDGIPDSVDRNPVFNYETPGTYTVNLTASDTNGTDSKLATITVLEKPVPVLPLANFTSYVIEGYAPLTVQFTDLSEKATSWNWNFGDGTVNSTVQNPTHVYSTAGNYTVTLTAINSAGSNTITKSNYIKATAPTTVKPPVIYFWASRTSGTVPVTIGFTDASTNTPTVWYWDFGDGTNSTLKNPRHTYTSAGTYSITLTASNAGGSATKTRYNYITLTGTTTQKPVASFTSNVTSGKVPLSVLFSDTSTGTPTAWNWNFGDGTANATVKNPVHVFSKAGVYTVTLTASNSAGSSTIKKSSYITTSSTTPALVADFSSNVTSGTAPLNVAFTDKSTGTPTAWNWSFGDGTYSTVKNPAHLYSKAGNYTVKLTVKNAAGSTNTVTKTNYIKVATPTTAKIPVVSFWASRTSGTVPITIGFTDASTNTPTAWKWSFGDGTYSTVQNPRHTYSKAGTYSITLTASNAAGSAMKTRYSYLKLT
ncbi:MAG: PKD domain-containing protein [Methanosarcina sp.]